MAHQSTPPPAQRIAVLAVVFTLHILLFLFVLATNGMRASPPLKPGILSIVSLAADTAAHTPPPPPTLPSKIAETNRPLIDLVRSDETDPNATALPAGGCATLQLVTDAVLADPIAVDAILRAPPAARSIADAIVIWNGGWAEVADSIDAPLGAVREVAELHLRSLDQSCLDEPVVGPRLIAIPDGGKTMFIVFGSGNWRWRDLLGDGKINPASTADEPWWRAIVAPLQQD